MQKFLINIILKSILVLILISPSIFANSLEIDTKIENRPILVIVADKMDSIEFINSQLPGINRLLTESAYGLMVIRSASGYTNTNSGLLTLGAGNRSVAPNKYNGAYEAKQKLGENKAKDYWNWVNEIDVELDNNNIVVPEIGAAKLLAEQNERKVIPGLLGSLFRENNWATVLIGNSDNSFNTNRPVGWLLMDLNGIVTAGSIGKLTNKVNNEFPYLYQFDSEKVIDEIKHKIAPQNLIVVEFGDFLRLNRFQEEVLPTQFELLKQQVWKNFDEFIREVLVTWSKEDIDLMIVSPSLSNESWRAKRWLTPFVVRSKNYVPGILTSRTTNWNGLVANIDFLPTIINLSGINDNISFSGRKVEGTTISGTKSLAYLKDLNHRLNAILIVQRSVIDGYLSLIVLLWVLVVLGLFIKKTTFINKLLLILLSAPFALIIQPAMPPFTWGFAGFVLISSILAVIIYLFFKEEKRLLILVGLTWVVLVIDQICGWNLIRYSALGYSPASSSRFYGMGNEIMGMFLAISLILAHLLNKYTKLFWATPLVLISSIIILGAPRWGTNFGGTLAAIFGFTYYIIKLYKWKLNYRKIILSLVVGLIIIFLFGWWDLSRPAIEQTHIGRFFNLVAEGDFVDVGLVITRKLRMNIRLFTISSWTKIVILAFGITLFIRKYIKQRVDKVIWQGILGSGVAAAVFNDSGVVALGTCLAVGFTFMLYQLSNLNCK